MMNLRKTRPLSSLLGLSLEGRRLEGVVLRRTNGSIVVQNTFVANLALDPLTSDSVLVGREIRNHLEAAGVRERRCIVGIPMAWALTLQTKLPDLPEADVASLLRIEAERGFPYAPDTLLISKSLFQTSGGERYATQVAVLRDHLSKLADALQAARLKPVTFSLGICALQAADKEAETGVLALAVAEDGIVLQLTCGGGVASLRTLEGVVENETGQKSVDAELVAREIRITLGQLPAGVRSQVRSLRLYGHPDFCAKLVEDLRPRLESMEVEVERMTQYPAREFSVNLPKEALVSAAFSLAARRLVRQTVIFEFRLPTSSPWQRFVARSSSKKLAWAGATAGAVALLFVLTVLFQHWQISRLRSRWEAISATVAEVEIVQGNIKQFRPWFDDSLRGLNILQRLTEAFPESGTVTAKTVEIRDLNSISCSGSARDSAALLATLDSLRAASEVSDLQVDTHRGKSPVLFTFNFRWADGGGL